MENYVGVIQDPRPLDKQNLDFKHEELAGAIPLNWVEKDLSQWKKYSIRNQDHSYSCVAQACAKALETITDEVESAHPIYRNRANYPSQGMWLQNAGEIVRKIGTTSEDKEPSQNINEDAMNQDVKSPSTIKATSYIMVDTSNIDHIAEAIEIAKHCPIIVHGFLSEWNDMPVYNPNGTGDLSHGICAVDYFLYKGKKCILIDDSWGAVTAIGNSSQRILTEDYLKLRCTGGMYFVNVAPTDQKPKYTFAKYLTYGMKNDPDVKVLQQILAYEGLFPANLDTGNYANITASAVLKWQIAHNVASLDELKSLNGHRCGPKTIAKLNELYN